MKKQVYIAPAITVVNVENTEVVCTSNIGYGGGNGNGGPNSAEAAERRGSDWSEFENF